MSKADTVSIQEKIVETKQYQDLETGEIFTAIVDRGEQLETEQSQKILQGGRHFWKLYLKDFLTVLGALEGKQVAVLIYILENTHPSNNIFIGSYRSISKACGVSLDTVSRTMQILLNENGIEDKKGPRNKKGQKELPIKFMYKIQNGVYFISPDVLMKGNDNKKSKLFSDFYAKKRAAEQATQKRKSTEQDSETS